MEQSIKLTDNRPNTCTDQIEKLMKVRDMLQECQQEAIKDADEWMKIHDMLHKVGDMLTKEKERLGYMAVYPIVNGCSQEAIFEGPQEDCKKFIETYLEDHPDMRGNIIVLPI